MPTARVSGRSHRVAERVHQRRSGSVLPHSLHLGDAPMGYAQNGQRPRAARTARRVALIPPVTIQSSSAAMSVFSRRPGHSGRLLQSPRVRSGDRMPPTSSNDRDSASGNGPRSGPIIIGGCPRSGTTLLRLMLDSHPNIACGPELKMIPAVATAYTRMRRIFGANLHDTYGVDDAELAERFGDLIVGLLAGYLQRQGKTRIAEKTPQNVHAFAVLPRLLPRSPLIHLIRDGRDVVCSLMKQTWIDPATGKPHGYTRDVRLAAEYWVKCVQEGRAVPGDRRGNYYELLYERLVEDPEGEMRKLLEFIGEPWDAAVLAFHNDEHDFARSEVPSHGTARFSAVHTSSVGRWRREWNERDRAAVNAVAGPLLAELGYGGEGW
jgi:hypothetical protein